MDEPEDPPKKPALEDMADAVRDAQQRVSELANRWLEGRFGAREGESPLAVASEIGARAEQFVRGFFRGLVDEPPTAGNDDAARATEGEAAKALKDAIPGMDQAARLLTRTTRTVSETFQEYLRDNAVDRSHPDAPVVIDGPFVVRHGTQLLGRIVQALGGALAEAGAEQPGAPEQPASEPRAHEGDKVAVKLDFAGLFRSLVLGRPAPERRAPPQDASDEPTEREPDGDAT
ncbi:MAG: hypothetical protein IT385_10015 [Deltaproteobacteria bacterium]|nr:hypothetical protein [Deltaproteobacteria bacterium]